VATRRNTDDPKAREVVIAHITEKATALEDTRAVVGLFETVEFETATSRVGGTEITLRRVVLTGPWEVITK
jgi:hypothetical protein